MVWRELALLISLVSLGSSLHNLVSDRSSISHLKVHNLPDLALSAADNGRREALLSSEIDPDSMMSVPWSCRC
jgi:hypothetical protein